MPSEGHALGNHSFSHPNMSWLGPKAIQTEIEQCEAELEHAGVPATTLFRPPEGGSSPLLESYLRRHGYRLVTWSLSPKDWKEPSADVLRSRLISGTAPGDIILLHDKTNTAPALDSFITVMHERGYQFTVIPEHD